MKYIKNSLILLCTAVLLQSCATVKKYKINETIEVVLDNEGTGGYQWNYIAIPEVTVVDSSNITLKEEGKLARYQKKYLLKGTKKGNYQLVFHHLRSFQKFDTVPQAHIKSFKIKIKK
jgi:hypothetical protein